MRQNLRTYLLFFLCTSLSLLVKAQDEITNTAGTSTTVAEAGTTAWAGVAASLWNNVKVADDDPGVPTANVTLPGGGISHFLRLSNFNFSIPTNYKINQIIVTVYGTSDVAGSIIVNSLKLMNTSGGGYTQIPASKTLNGFVAFELTPKKSTQRYGVSNGQFVYWNTNLTAADVNNPTFGLAIQFKNQLGVAATAAMDLISITLLLDPNIVLPVKLTSFSGTYKNQNTMLSWSTASEVSFEQFEVQRSASGTNFTTVASVLPNGGNGIKAQYLYSDNLLNQTGNVFYYRLKLIGKDGTGAYSQTILIRKDSKAVGQLGMYPNPVLNGHALIKMNSTVAGNVEFRVLDLSGKILIRQQANVLEGNCTTTLNNTNRLQGGAYILQMISPKGEMQSAKFTVVR